MSYGTISTTKLPPLINANLPNEGMPLVEKHTFTLEGRQFQIKCMRKIGHHYQSTMLEIVIILTLSHAIDSP